MRTEWRRPHAPDAGGTRPAGLTRDEWSGIERALHDSRYHVRPAPTSNGAPSRLVADNRRQGYRTTFGRDGIEIEPEGPAGWRLELSVRAFGYAGAVRAVQPATPQAQEKRVEYRRGPLTEWYLNGNGGLEQGFEVAQPPGFRGQPLVIAMAVGGTLVARPDDDGASFADASGPRLRYAGLKAWDADGQALSSRVEAGDQEIRLVVEAAEARFPVTVDPVFLHEATLEGRPMATMGQADARFGSAVAVSGDTLVVGARLEDNENTFDGGAVHVFVRSGTSWTLQQRLRPLDAVNFHEFGSSVAIDGDTVLIGAESDDFGGNNAGAAYVFVRSGTTWSQQQKLMASDAAPNDQFGYSVSVSGDTVVIGAEFADIPGAISSGAAWVFVRSGTTWSQQQKLVASDATASDFFVHVAVAGDTIVVGADSDDTAAGIDAGSAYVFVRSGTVWSQQQKLTALDGAANDIFGWSVGVAGDTVLVGAPFGDGPGAASMGAAYAFVRSGTTWNLQQKLTAGDAAGGDHLGWQVSLSGETALAVADHDDTANGVDTGSAYVFVRSGTTWTQQQRLTASDAVAGDALASASIAGDTVVAGTGIADVGTLTNAGEAYVFVRTGTTWSEQQVLLSQAPPGLDLFGLSVSVFGDTALVGTSAEDTNAGVDAGAAYVFVRSGATWVEQQKLEAADATPGDFFGNSVALFGDTVIVGAPGAATSAGPFAGAAYVFVRSGTTWSQQQKLEPADVTENFGTEVSISGNTAVIAEVTSLALGSAYVFVRSGTTWSQQQKLTPADGGANDSFASAVAVDGDTAFVGSPFDDTVAGLNAGSVYVFTRTGTTWNQQQKLEASDAVQSNTFGTSLGASGDTLVVGAPLLNVPAGGAAYVFTRSAGQWSQQQKLRASDGANNDRFGTAVSLSGDELLVGAPGDDTQVGEGTGSTYVFLRAGAAWSETQKLLAPNAAANDAFGQSVSLSGDVALVGTPSDDTPNGQAAGTAHVFRLVSTTADLALSQSDSPDPVGGLETLTYAIVVSNAGPETAHIVAIDDTLPAGSTFISAGGGGWSCGHTAGVVTCTRASLGVGAAPAVTLVVRAPVGPGTITNVAAVVHSGPDPVAVNNSDSESTVVTQAMADLAVTKNDGLGASVPGQPVSYTIVVSNAGPAPAIGAAVTDTPPASITGVTWTCAGSSGASCPAAAGAGPIAHTVNVGVGSILFYTLRGAVSPSATGNLSNTASVTAPPGVADPAASNNSATDTNVLTPQADLAISLSDSPDPVRAEGLLTYTIGVTNLGPSTASGLTLTDTLPAGVSFSSASPGAPACTHASGIVTCTLGALAPSASLTVSVQVTADPTTLGTISNTVSVAGDDPDPVLLNNQATEPTLVTPRAEGELSQGTRLRADLSALGGAPDQDLYRIHQEPHASYEVVVDDVSGDIGRNEGPALERLAADGTTVLQSSVPTGLGPSRSLRWMNTAGVEEGQYVRVRSQSCGSTCGADDVYRIRSWETTYRIPRFNNSESQLTVVLLHNTGTVAASGRVAFWSVAGTLLHEQAFDLPPKALLTLNTATLPGLRGTSGSMTVSHDAAHGVLAGKAVALEPATGFTFDSPMEPRLR